MLFRSIFVPTRSRHALRARQASPAGRMIAALWLAALGAGWLGAAQASGQQPDEAHRAAPSPSLLTSDARSAPGQAGLPLQLASAAGQAASPDTGAGPAESQPPLARLAAFGWRDSNDQPFDVDSLKGKPVVINFWATWCAPCVKEMPDLSALSEEVGQEAAFIGISLDKLDKVKRFTEKTPVAYPLLIADFKGLGLARQWGNQQGQMPYTVVLNAQGQLHWQHAGIVNVDELRSMLKSSELR